MNGVLLVDKEPGMTSHDVVARVRRILGTRSVGHAGTLDPLASGLLLMLVGEATKVSDYLLTGDKSYEVTVRLGIRTDSMDITGEVIEEKPVTVSEETVRAAVAAAKGTLDLAVPVHSAVKVNGRKLYEMAHKGEKPDEVPIRSMSFYDVEFKSFSASGEGALFTARLRCSKGSFIRAWAEYVGHQLGCGGTVEVLRRIESAPFQVEKALTLAELERQWEARAQRDGAALGAAWVPLAESLPHFGRIEITGYDATLLRNGQISKGIQADLLRQIELGKAPRPMRVIHREERSLLALLVAEPGEFYKIRRVFVS